MSFFPEPLKADDLSSNYDTGTLPTLHITSVTLKKLDPVKVTVVSPATPLVGIGSPLTFGLPMSLNSVSLTGQLESIV